MSKSYGFIEITGVVAAIDALDIMCKTADVELASWERKPVSYTHLCSCASSSVCLSTTLNCMCIPFWSKYPRISATNFSSPSLPESADG